jgi:O-antigen ligase
VGLVFIILMAAAVWPLSRWMRANPGGRSKAFVAAGLLPYLLAPAHFVIPMRLLWALDSWRGWPGYIHGFEFTALDFLAAAFYLSQKNIKYSTPYKLTMSLYLCATIISSFRADFPVTSLFYSWQIARMSFIFVVVYKEVRSDRRVAFWLMDGMTIGIIIEAFYVVFERIGFGMTQTPGTYIHQNTLGMVSHFTMFPLFAILLGGNRGRLTFPGLIASLLVVVSTASRGTIIVAAVGLAIVLILSVLKRWTTRKGKILLASVVAAFVFAPLGEAAIEHRFAASHGSLGATEEDAQRIAYKIIAREMIAHHAVFGVGANNFDYVGNAYGYFSRYKDSGWRGNVHNVYMLAAAETGYFGAVTLLLLLFSLLVTAIHAFFSNRGDQNTNLILGLGVSIFIVYLHSLEEWIFVMFETQYFFAIATGIISGLAGELKSASNRRSRAPVQVDAKQPQRQLVVAPYRSRPHKEPSTLLYPRRPT